jgi:hypothetical protein
MMVIEVIQHDSVNNQLQIKQTRLEGYASNVNRYSYWKIKEGTAHKLMYSVSARNLDGRTNKAVNINYLMKVTMLGAA